MEEITLIAHKDKKSPISEAYRSIRTNLIFASAGKKEKIISITSATPGEGKSTTSSNLAIIMAQAEKRVLLIDCDLRKLSLQKKFNLQNKGLTNYIAMNESLDDVLYVDVVPGLDLLLSGPVPPNPSELLGSKKMEELLKLVEEQYDYIFLDLPPILAVTDAAVLAKYINGTIFVMQAGALGKNEALEAKKRLTQSGVEILGIVLNKVEPTKHSGSYYYYYGEKDLKP
ncbi:CpsD/CapB family tyrosine-protein kinase [Veillonella criceti]|uniref:non-specific protein-tyrosine kinase n=1 Tax=Veillonella criceti TaxID=103891 RepID=A0A380NPT3_9FIRM|nr:CpsD/CapB family tyrosine-protein kinase [Veillonella criceti]SUP44750.1 Tyrosine-protein kinase YwqD [Veillonella criceti]